MPNAHEYMSDSIMCAASHGVSGSSARKDVRMRFGLMPEEQLKDKISLRRCQASRCLPPFALVTKREIKAPLFFTFQVEYRCSKGRGSLSESRSLKGREG
jgi:hypothetical protein